MAERILVVALDGGDFRLLRPWMDAGELPELAALARDGAHGPLRSVVPPLTPPAWASFATGKHPGRHGVFGFTRPGAEAGKTTPVNASDVEGATLWDYLRESGIPAAVVGMPMTYPPTPIPGALIGSFMTPLGRRDFTHPPELLEELESRFGPYPLYLDTPVFSANQSAANVGQLLRAVEDEAEAKFRVAAWLAERVDARVVMLHVWGTDRVQHELWNLLDETHPRHNGRLAARVRGEIMAYYRGIDRRIGELRRALGEGVTTLIVSDHGFGPVRTIIDLNWWLAQEGFIRFRRGLPTLLRRLAWRCGLTASMLTRLRVAFERFVTLRRNDGAPTEMVRNAQRRSRRLVLSFRDVDWERTTAYSPPGLSIGSIMVNRRSDTTGTDHDAIRTRLVERLGAFARELIGPHAAEHIYTAEALYGADCAGRAPDVLFLPLDDGYLPTNLFDFIDNRVVVPNRVWPGNHRMDGVFIAHGPDVRAGLRLEGVGIVDVAPTLLHLLGCPVASDMDGRPLTELLDEQSGRARPVHMREPAQPHFSQRADLTDAERDEIIARLRSLGYM